MQVQCFSARKSDYFEFVFAQTTGVAINLIGGTGVAFATRVMIELAP